MNISIHMYMLEFGNSSIPPSIEVIAALDKNRPPWFSINHPDLDSWKEAVQAQQTLEDFLQRLGTNFNGPNRLESLEPE